ncbi:SpoIIE family protein phosphatase [Kitasatospora atroaurantiaca]|nr:SpoIIE family protein phosphatase [Kitasatospora atroaurantiaca]
MDTPKDDAPADLGGRRLDEAVLAALFSKSPIGLFVFDPELRLVRFNSAAEGMRGVPSEDILGKSVSEVAPGFDTEALERMARQVLESGEPLREVEHRGFTPADSRSERTVSVSAFRLEDPQGRVLGVAAAVVDVTDRSRARARLDLLHEAEGRIGSTLDVVRTAQELADTAVPRLADTIAVAVLDCVIRGEAPPAGPIGEALPLRRAGYRSVARREAQGITPVGEVTTFAFPSPFTQSLADLQPRLVADLGQEDSWLAQDEARAERIRAAGAHSLIVVPLQARGVVLGLAELYRWKRPDPFDDDDLSLAQEIADRAALYIDNARRYTREHTVASVLQRSLLPLRLPVHAAVETAHTYIPGLAGSASGAGGTGGAGGDWYDVIPLSGARVALVVGDVVGHGLQAAATMGRLRAAIHALSALDLAPDELLGRLDDLVIRLAQEQPHPSDEHPLGENPAGATCAYAVYDPISRRCTLALAGHPAPLLVPPDGEAEVLDIAPGPPLGLGGLPFEVTELVLTEGTLLALYTNGLLAAHRHDPEVALAQLGRVLAHPSRSLPLTCDAAVYALIPERPEDDAVLLLARTRVLDMGQVASWTLPPDPAIVSIARTLATRQLADWGLDDLAFTTELIVSELVTNAIRYSSGQVQLRLIHDRTLICEVADGSSTAPHLRHARVSDEGGRGLFLVAQVTQGWGTRYSREGKTVWAEQDLP